MSSTIQATFGLDINPLKAGFNRAIGLSASAARSVGSNLVGYLATPLAGIAAAASGALAFGALAGGVKHVISAGAEMERLHKQTGLSVGSISTLKGVFGQADVSADNLGESIGKMQRNLFQAAKVGGPAGSALRLLHLDVDQLVKLKPEEEFQQIGTAIAGLPSPLARSSAAMALFGKSGAELIPVFDEMKNVDFGQLSAKSAIMQKDAETFHKTTVAFHKARVQLSNVFVGLADGLAPSLLALGTFLSKKNALNFGVELGKGLRTATNYLAGIFQNPKTLIGPMREFITGTGLEFANVIQNGAHAAVQFFHSGVAALQPLYSAAAGGFSAALQGGMKLGIATLLDGALDFQALLNTTGRFFGANLDAMMTSAVDAFSKPWVQALLNPISFLGTQLVEAALGFGKTMAKSMTGNIAGALQESAGLLSIGGQVTKFINAAVAQHGKKGAAPFDFGNAFAEEKGNLLIGNVGRTAAQYRFQGSAQLAQATAPISAALTESGKLLNAAFAELKSADLTKDVRGATKHFQAALAMLAQIQKAGQKALAPFAPGTVTAVPQAPLFTSLNGGLRTGGLNTGGLHTGGLLGGAYAQSNLLTAAERRGFEDLAVAKGNARQGSTASAFAAIRSGDHQRRRAEEKQRIIAKEGQEKSNELLEGILGTLKDGLTGED